MLKSKWSWLQRNTQKFLAARNNVLGLEISGASEQDIHYQTMRIYRERAGSKDPYGNVFLAPSFKFVDAANYLSTQPKFNVIYGGSSRKAINYRTSEGELPKETGAQTVDDSDSGSDAAVEEDGKSDLGEGSRHGRPIGANRQKLRDAALKKEVTLGREAKGMKEAMQKAAAQSSANFQQLLDIQLLDRMEEGAEKVQLWKTITEERKLRIKKRTQQLALELKPNTQLSSTNSAVTDTTSQQSKGILWELVPMTGKS